MKRIAIECGEGVAAGNKGRKMSFVLLVDDEQMADDMIDRAVRVKVQAKMRSGAAGWGFDEVDGSEVKLTDVLSKSMSRKITKDDAVRVFGNVDIETKIEMLFDMALPVEAIKSTLDAQLAKGAITQQDRELAEELLNME